MADNETRVYGGNPNLIHIDDGQRADMGIRLAELLETRMRNEYTGERSNAQRVDQNLCPGCYMIAVVNMAITLADANGQSRKELARCLKNAFAKLEANPEQGLSEEIEILLDPCDD